MTNASILTLGQRGEGIAEIDGKRVFVPLTLPGETVDIVVEGERGTLEHVLAPSPHRIAPFCPHFGVCGGCQLQHLDAETYTAFKHGLVETALSHAGIATPVDPLVDARGNGRRRATLHARREGAGFMAFHSHDLHPLDLCPILVPALATAPAIARAVYGAVGDCDVAITSTLTGLDVAVRPDRKARVERLTPLAQLHAVARLSLDGEPVIQAQAPVIRMGQALVEIPPASFLQATEAAETALAGLVVAALSTATTVADLFCGVGPFALRLAERTKIYAADSDRGAIAALAKAHRNTRGLKAITAERRDLFREPLTAIELNRFDGLVFDPPRAGAEAQAREIARSKVKTVVAVSCEPKTFARDARLLIEGGYRLERVTPVDQFAWSTHVELVGVFRR
ncbi:MAG: RNA methyltransferase [Devosia sp.]|nr:RNA methyltransferase [Devosia sp.]